MYRFDSGTIDGIDVSGLTLAMATHIPGNVTFSDGLHGAHELGAEVGGHGDHSAPGHPGSGLRPLFFHRQLDADDGCDDAAVDATPDRYLQAADAYSRRSSRAGASVPWMLALGLVMGIEKNARWGRRIVKPLGYALLGAGFTLLIFFGRAPG